MGSSLNLSLDYGRSPKGERVNDEKPTAPGETVSTAAVLTEHGIEAECQYLGTLTRTSRESSWVTRTVWESSSA